MKRSNTQDAVPTGWSRRAVLRAIVWLAGSAPPMLLTACGAGPAGSATVATGGAASGPAASRPPQVATATSGPGPAAGAATAASVTAAPTGAAPTAAPGASTSVGTVPIGTASTVASSASPTVATTHPAQASAAASAPAAAAQTCVLSPEQTEGPYYIDENLNRSDITEGKPGVPLLLRFTVQNASTCRPLQGATLDVWHCDAVGVYSGYAAANSPGVPGGQGPPPSGNPPQGGPPQGGGPGTSGGGGHAQPVNKETFLRGNQQTDAAGTAAFTTIYPGWYTGRTTHIHVKVHAGGTVVHTGQLYMDDALTATIYAQAPYAAHGKRDTTNATDGIYANGGAQSTLSMTKSGGGYVGTIVLGVKV